MDTNGTRAALYARVSSRNQEDNTSLDGQLERLAIEAGLRGYTVAETVHDIASGGYTQNRPGLDKLLALAEAHQIDVVLCYAVDRFMRDESLLHAIEHELGKNGVRVEYLDVPQENDLAGRIIKTINALGAEQERAKIGERTARGKLDKAKKGSVVVAGRVPYGYTYESERDQRGNTVNGWYELDQERAPAVKRIFEMSASGVSAYDIAQALETDGVPTYSGKAWGRRSVQAIVKNPAYRGQLIYNKTKRHKDKYTGKVTYTPRPESEWIIIDVPAIVTPELWHRANGAMSSRVRRAPNTRNKNYLLSGHIRCECGARVTSQSASGNRGYYRCVNRAKSTAEAGVTELCTVKPIPYQDADCQVWEELGRALKDPERIAKGYELHSKKAGAKVKEWKTRLEVVEDRLAELKQERDGWETLAAKGKITLEKFDEKVTEIDQSVSKLMDEQGRLGTLIAQEIPSQAKLDALQTQFGAMIDLGLENADYETARRVLDLLNVTVILGQDDIEIRGIVSGKVSPQHTASNALLISIIERVKP